MDKRERLRARVEKRKMHRSEGKTGWEALAEDKRQKDQRREKEMESRAKQKESLPLSEEGLLVQTSPAESTPFPLPADSDDAPTLAALKAELILARSHKESQLKDQLHTKVQRDFILSSSTSPSPLSSFDPNDDIEPEIDINIEAEFENEKDIDNEFPLATGVVRSSVTKNVWVKAVEDYNGLDESYLSFREGDIFSVVDRSDPHIWIGEFSGSFGGFPKSCVSLLEPLPSSSSFFS